MSIKIIGAAEGRTYYLASTEDFLYTTTEQQLNNMKTFIVDLRNIEDSVFSLERTMDQITLESSRLKKSMSHVKTCYMFLDGLLRTHTKLELPKHDSGDSLFFFKDNNNESVLITELNPPDTLMPEMKRISIHDIQKRKMEDAKKGYLIQRVFINGEKSSHSLVLICFESFIFEEV
jgi:hypothetical protein